jgi:iron complex outermembrane receptor protein
MRVMIPFKWGSKRFLMIAQVCLLMGFGLTDQVRADDPAGASPNTTAQTPPGVTPKPHTSTDTKPAAGTPAPTTNAKPAASTSTAPATKPAANSGSQDLGGLSIDALLNVTVTSAGQKEQKLSDVAAAMTVLNSDDIERSGATNIPDLLRYVPGVEVGQASNTGVSVTIRGFGGTYATKLLVLVDGRSIYDPLFGGVDWQYQRMMMEDIDRVEVIRGPGATIWGANAVNGVINIITKDARDTQGGFLSTVYGTKEQGIGEFRYGFQPTDGLSVRLYGKYENVAASDPLPGIQQFDELQNGLIGFRADYHPSSDDHVRLSSEASSTRTGDVQFLVPGNPGNYYNETGGGENVNFVYEHNFDTDNQLTVQSYYDRFTRTTDPALQLSNLKVQTADLQVRHSLSLNLLPIKQELVYGAEYRLVDSQLGNTNVISWDRSSRNDQTFSLFAQTDLHLIDNVLTLTMGAKYDHNDYSGNEVQPSVRLLWKIDNKNSLWWAVSRAVREPDTINVDPVAPGVITGNTNLKSEVLTAYEMGYRVQPIPELSLDIAAFYNNYDNLIESYFQSGSFFPVYEQFQKAQIYGIEPSFTAQLQPWWKLSGSYSLASFHTDNSGIPGNFTPQGSSLDDIDPTNQFSLRSSFNLPNNIDIDVGGRYVDKIAGANGYFAADVRVAWRPTPNWEVSVVGQNLFDADHVENPNVFGNAAYVGPEVYGKVVFKF